MILQRVEIAVRQGFEAAFESALGEVRQRVFMSPGFRGFTVSQGTERTWRYLVQVRWETPEELSDFESARLDRAWAPVEPFLAAPLEVDHFVERPLLAEQGPGVITDLDWLTR